MAGFLEKSSSFMMALRIALVYAVVAGAWILLSDWGSQLLADDSALLSLLQTVKGFGFVAVTAVLLFFLLRKQFTCLRQAREHVEDMNRVLRATQASNQLLLIGKREKDLYNGICSNLVNTAGYALAWVGLIQDNEGTKIYPVACENDNSGADYIGQVSLIQASEKYPEEPVIKAAKNGKMVTFHSLTDNATSEPWLEAAQQCGFTSCAALPLTSDGVVIGAIGVYSKNAMLCDNDELTLLKELAGDISYGVEVLRIRHRKRKVESDLRETNRKLVQTLEDLRQKETQLVNQERQRALTIMASGIAHDFNNSLAPILGFSSMLLDNPELQKDTQKVAEYLGYIQQAANHGAETVRRMRKFYRPHDHDVFEMVDVNNVIMEAVSITKPLWKEESQAAGISIAIKTELLDTTYVQGNTAELHDVVTNLIFNAVDAMTEDGTIHISTKRNNQKLVLRFSDDGKGMSEEVQNDCLQPFYTTKVQKGSGLGLATVQGIVQRHGGNIDIDSKEGKGTTVTISLPLAGKREEEKEAEEDSAQSAGREYKILVVEDDNIQCDLLQELLTKEGHKVNVAYSGSDALKEFYADWYDIVLTDRSMPDINGDEVAAKVKETISTKPVIMLTGFGDIMNAANEKPAGVDLLIEKPVDQRKLSRVIRQAMAHKDSSHEAGDDST